MSQKQHDQHQMINQTSDLIQYSNFFTEMGLLFCYEDLNIHSGYSNDFIDLDDMVSDGLTLQNLNERLKFLSGDKYIIPSSVKNFSMSSYQITNEFTSSLIMLTKFKDDLFMRDMIRNRLRTGIKDMWSYTYFKMRNAYLAQLDSSATTNS